MNQIKVHRSSAVLMTQFLFIAWLYLGMADLLAAQVTISNTGNTGSSGVLMTNGSQIATTTGQVSIWADSSSGRGKITNGTGSGQLIATWPCSSTGCMPYASSATGNPETALSLGSLNVPLLAGSNAPQWSGTSTYPYINFQQNAFVSEFTNNSAGTTANKLVVLLTSGGLSEVELASTSKHTGYRRNMHKWMWSFGNGADCPRRNCLLCL
jgi:hypothetical protein